MRKDSCLIKARPNQWARLSMSESLTTLCFHCFLGMLMSSDIERNGLTHCSQLCYSYISVVCFFLM